jgi:hypothetical protein
MNICTRWKVWELTNESLFPCKKHTRRFQPQFLRLGSLLHPTDTEWNFGWPGNSHTEQTLLVNQFLSLCWKCCIGKCILQVIVIIFTHFPSRVGLSENYLHRGGTILDGAIVKDLQSLLLSLAMIPYQHSHSSTKTWLNFMWVSWQDLIIACLSTMGMWTLLPAGVGTINELKLKRECYHQTRTKCSLCSS